MGDERESGTVKILDETLREKEQEEKAEIKRLKKNDPSSVKFFRISKWHSGDCGSFEEGEPSNHHTGLTTRNSPCRSEDSREDRGEEEDFLAIKPPQKMSRKEKPCRRKAEKREEKRRHRIYSAGGKRARRKGKEREHELRKRHREQQNKARQDWATQRQRDMAREHSGTGQKHWEQLKRKREQQDRGPKGEEQRKEHEARKGVSVPRQTLREDYGDKSKASRWRCSPVQLPQECFEVGDGWRPVNEEKMEEHDLLSSLGDIRDKRNTSSAESLAESGAGLEEEVEGSTRKELQEEEEMRSNSEASGLSAEEMSDEEMSENEEPENENHILVVPESQFDRGGYRDSEETEEEVGKGALQSSTLTKEDYVPNSLTVCPPPNLSPTELKQELPKYLPALQGCRSVEEFQCLNKIEEGTYGVVYRAKDKKTGEIVALKRLKMEKEKEGFPITSLREINIILKAQHPNIITVREIVVGSNMDKIYIVMNYMEHDLRSLLKSMKQPFLPGEVKTLMIQLLHGVKHLHDNWILHRDLKTSNLLLGHTGVLKIGDFGLAREYGSPLKAYTPVVVTPWYRAPELLLGVKEYSTAIDMWSVGCIFGELLMKKPLFPGNSDIDQINTVFKVLGTPSEKIWPGYSDLPAVKKMTFSRYPYNNLRKCFGAFLSNQGFDLMNRFLTYCPGRRINAEDSLKHEYFFETPLPVDPCMLPTWPAKNEQQWVKGGMSRWPLEGGLDCSHLGSNDLKERGFHLATTNQRASATGPGFSLKF